MQCVTLPRITELNPHLLCVLCGGYYIDATSIIECLHAFCKSCIVRYLETHKYCPICDVLVHKTEPLQNIRPDVIRQSIVYKLVPNLYKKEMRNRRNFYVKVNPQQQPVCAESRGEITESSNFFSMDDLINLSLEYVDAIDDKNFFLVAKGSKRYFRCRAAVTVKNLRKLLATKYALGIKHEVHLFLNGNQLPDHFKLLDIAYLSSWKRVGYIRMLYEILTVDSISANCKKVDPLSSIEQLKNGNVENGEPAATLAHVKLRIIEDENSLSKTEPVNVEIPESPLRNPSIITVDLTISPPSNGMNEKVEIQPSNTAIVSRSNAQSSSPVLPLPETTSVCTHKKVVAPVVAIPSVNKIDAPKSTSEEPLKKIFEKEKIEKKPSDSVEVKKPYHNVETKKPFENAEKKKQPVFTEMKKQPHVVGNVKKTSKQVKMVKKPVKIVESLKKSSENAVIKKKSEMVEVEKSFKNAESAEKQYKSTESSRSVESNPQQNDSEVEAKELRIAEPSSLKMQIIGADSFKPTISERKTKLTSASSAAAAPSKSEALKSTPALTAAAAAKLSANSKSDCKKARRGDRSDSLPPVPALRMINQTPKLLVPKLLTVAGTSRTDPKVSIPRMTKLQTTASKVIINHSSSSISSAVSSPMPVSVPAATDLISLYSKSAAAHGGGSSSTLASSFPPPPPPSSAALKKSSAGAGVSILRIDPKTLSPIESTSAPPTNASSTAPKFGGETGGASSPRKLLPYRPVTSGSYTSSGSIYSCPSTPPIHLAASSPFGKLSSAAAQFYAPYPPLERSLLHPMNELVRRMFPSFNFGGMHPTKTSMDASMCGLPSYPQSIPTAVTRFLTAKPAVTSKSPAKHEKTRRKQPPMPALIASSLNGSVSSGGGGGGGGASATAIAATAVGASTGAAGAGSNKSSAKGSGNNVVVVDRDRSGKRTSAAAVTNGQIKGATKRKNTELSDFSINNLLPAGDSKRLPPAGGLHSHACTADGVTRMCDQAKPPVSASSAAAHEFRSPSSSSSSS